MNELDFYGAQTFKKLAVKARSVAEAKVLAVDKLRNAYSSIQGYYS